MSEQGTTVLSERERIEREIKRGISEALAGRASESQQSKLKQLLEDRGSMVNSPASKQLRELRNRIRQCA